ncbi:transglutaminase TgpA family protein [Nocardioides marmorisolisilvae]|uniref:Transglutaminase-like domain-containing protein n=1 Tax=Nocardioides marmorisolisilvae TaxID=1542737 RepID=A0A3N0DWA6_9ACTN|nr:DUF3488 and transglutaminase-like domain-containing protein [Nocardioides marmorisolisilvae]RNL79733.1 hypothetical protein EFL95_12310 [Nocardioides marmorisolisilvae]
MSAVRSRFPARLLVALLANLMTWMAIHSWNGMVEEPLKFTGPALTAALLIAVTGAVLRGTPLPSYLVLVVQILVVLVWFFHHQDVSTSYGGWLPTWDGISAISDQIRTGASAINTYAAPVRAARVTAPMYLLGLALLLLLAVDFIAAGLRRPTWAGLPILVALTVPISVLSEPLAAHVFIGTAVLFVMLLATVENEQTLAWGQAVTGRRQRDDTTDQVLDRASAQLPALKIGAVAAVAALVLPIFIPIGRGVLDAGPDNGQSGRGAGQQVQLRNPMVDLRRNLVQEDHLPLLDVRTDAADPSYLRTTVLDTFNGTAWVPGHRDLPETNIAQGRLPDPSGVSPTTPGTTSTWNLKTTENFRTTWLPAPYLTRDISVDEGDWRYDITTLDLANTDKNPPIPVSYRLTGFAQVYDPAKLNAATVAPDDILKPMTAVPKLTATVSQIAKEVTASGTTDYAKVVLLQNWFRNDGGFRYSLDPAPGDGMDQLERFITTEKVGYCEQFAAAMAVMTRALGIPARVVVGFLAPEKLSDETYEFTSDDLHAWPEVYFRGSGWVRFEPTPSTRTGTAPSWTRGNVRPQPTNTPSASPTTSAPIPKPTKKPTENTQTPTASGTSSTTYLRLAVVLLLLCLLAVPALLRRAQRRRRFTDRANARLEVENLWRELRATATDLRIPWPEGRSPRTAARIVCHRVNAGPDEVNELLVLVGVLEQARYRERFVLDEDTRARCREATRHWITVLVEATPSRRSRVALVWPRSALSSQRRAELDVPAVAHADANSFTEVG